MILVGVGRVVHVRAVILQPVLVHKNSTLHWIFPMGWRAIALVVRGHIVLSESWGTC